MWGRVGEGRSDQVPDAAFSDLGEGAIEALLEPRNRENLRALLEYHIVPAELTSLVSARPKTLGGKRIRVRAKDGAVQENGVATVVTADLEATNGVIHVIDAVLRPPTTPARTTRGCATVLCPPSTPAPPTGDGEGGEVPWAQEAR